MHDPTLDIRIDLLRHGETVGGARLRGRLDDPLTEEGWRQMKNAVATRGPWDAIVSSPLARCAEFARAFAAECAIPLRLDARLCELDFGAWEGRDSAEIMKTEAEALRRFWADPYRHPPPGGEPLPDFEQRVLAAWNDLRAHGTQRLLVITHGGVIRLILCRLRGLPRSELLKLDVPLASLHRVAATDERAA